MTAEETVKRYVAGFLFARLRDTPERRVLLVRKTHPTWQAGYMNGIGGEIEEGESPLTAMMREYMEEANYLTNAWEIFASEHGPGYEVFFFRHTLEKEWELKDTYVPPMQNDKGEAIEWCNPHEVKYPVVGNLNWLLPLALDPRPIQVRAQTTGDIRKLGTW